jgi:CubicO group peptidase (beta-lactamase class C family)
MKFLKLSLKLLVFCFILLNAFIIVSGKSYVYKAIKIGYLKGHNTATIEDYQYFENRIIENGEAVQWPEASDYNKEEISPALRARLEQNQSIAFTVIQNDSILYETYWGIGSRTSRTNSFSMAKSVVGMLIGVAIQEGYIESIDQKITDFITEYDRPGTHYNTEVTIKHLLTMSSGMDWHEDYYNPFGVTAEAYFTQNLTDLMLSIDFTEKPGEKWHYQSGSTQLMGLIIERATGQKLSEYLSTKLWKPLNATDSADWMIDKEDGIEKAYCCINSNALDFARFGQLYLDGGKWNGVQLIDSAFVTATLSPDLEPHYGYSWWLYDTQYKYPAYAMRGVNGQYVIIIPALDLVAVRLGHKREAHFNKSTLDLDFYVREIISQFDVLN